MNENERTPLVHETLTPAASPDSLMEQLRAKRQELADTKDVYIVLTGFEGTGLSGRHRLIERTEVEIIGKKVMRETKDPGDRNMFILIDTIINSTLGFYVAKGDTYESLMTPDGSEPVLRWDQLAEGMGWTPDGEARSALYYAFADNEFAIGQYGISLNRWMGNTGIKIDEEFLGGLG